MRPPLVLLLAALTGCGLFGTEGTVEGRLGEPFELAVGQVGVVDGAGLVVRFEEVPWDNRCAVDAECISAGHAQVLLVVRGQGGVRALRLDTSGPGSVSLGMVDLVLHDLLPEPRLSLPRASRVYRASLLVRRR